MTGKHKTSKSEELQRIIDDYVQATGADQWDMNKVADWAIANKRWKVPRFDPRRMCARELSRAAREELFIDPQGREVRKKHCYMVDEGGQYHWLWVDIESAKPDQMRKSAAFRRRSSLGDVQQLATDIASYNDNNRYGATIEMSFNFDKDLEELQHPEDYPEDPDDA